MKTLTQMLRNYTATDGITKIYESSFSALQDLERIQLLLAYNAGQRNHLTFDQWYEASFNEETQVETPTELDYSKITNVFVGGIDMEDFPDFCDAYIESADYGDREMSAEELEILNEDSGYVSEAAHSQIC